MTTRNQTLNGKVDCRGPRTHSNTKNWMDSIEKPLEFEWRTFPGHTTLQILREIQKLMGELNCTPDNSYDEGRWRIFSWRSYSMSRVHTSSIFFHLYQKVGFVKIGPVLEATTNYHQGKPGIEIRIESLSGKLSIMGKDLKWTQQVREEFDRKIAYSRRRRHDSRIVPYSHQETDKPSARAKLKPTSSSLQPPALEQIPIHERKWFDFEPTPERYSTRCCDISKKMIALLWHEQNILRAEEGPQREISCSARWSDNTCVDHLQRGGGRKKWFQLCTNNTGLVILYFRAIQGHSRKNYCGSISIGERVDSRRLLRIHLSHRKRIDSERKSSWMRSTKVFSQPLIPWMKMGSIKKVTTQIRVQACVESRTRRNAIILHDTPPPEYIERVVSRKNHETLNRHDLLIQLPSTLFGEQICIRMLKHKQAAVNWQARRNL